MFVCLFVCLCQCQKVMRKDTWSVCHPDVRKDNLSVCHQNMRKDTWSVCHPWSVCCMESLVLTLQIISCLCLALWGTLRPPAPPSIVICHYHIYILFRQICVRSYSYFIMLGLGLVGDPAHLHTPQLYLCSCFHVVSDCMFR
jgi:hypothetical protein